jgi:hypothetical protein
MYIGWKVFLPISLGFLLFISGYIFSFQLQVNNFYYLLSLEQIEIFLAQHTTYTDLVSTINGSER